MTALIDQYELIKKAQKIKHKLILTDKILYDPSFVMATIHGRRQLGKSMLALMYLYEMYQDWDEVFKHLFYTKEEFIEFLYKASMSGKRIPLVVLDDAGVGFGANQWNLDRKGSILMSNIFDTIASVVKGCIFTLPNDDNLIKSIRTSENIISIKVTLGRGKYDRLGTAYTHHKSPWGDISVSRDWVEQYDVRLPDKVYQRYFEIRKSYSTDTLQKMREYIQGDATGVFLKEGKKYAAIEIEEEG